MFDPLSASLKISGSGIRAQSTRLKIISENIANSNSTGSTPGAASVRSSTGCTCALKSNK